MALKKILFCITFATLMFSCSNSYELEKEDNIIKVYISDNSEIFSNGIQVNSTDFENQIKELANSNGKIFYCRESNTTTSSNRSLEAMDIILKYKLPITYYKDKTFTEEGYVFPKAVD